MNHGIPFIMFKDVCKHMYIAHTVANVDLSQCSDHGKIFTGISYKIHSRQFCLCIILFSRCYLFLTNKLWLNIF